MLKEFFEANKGKSNLDVLEKNIMWRENKAINSNHENKISKFYGKDLWESLKGNMKSCEEYYNASPEEEDKKKEREKLREGYQKTLALWNLYQDKIQPDLLNLAENRAYFLRATNGVSISRDKILKSMDKYRMYGPYIISHEIGHFIDYQYDKRNNTRVSRSSLFKKGILWDNARQDFLNMFSEEDESEKKFLDNFTTISADNLYRNEMISIANRKIEKKIQDLSGSIKDNRKDFIDSYIDILDMFENVTNKDMKFTSFLGTTGHGFEYWAKDYNHTEIFAEMFGATLSNWKSAEHIIHFFPTAYDTFLEMVTEMIEESNSQTIDFLNQNPTADEFIDYLQSQVTTQNSLTDLYGLCDNSPKIGNQVKSMIASWDTETFSSYFYTDKHYHNEVRLFLEKYSSEEQRNYMKEIKEILGYRRRYT